MIWTFASTINSFGDPEVWHTLLQLFIIAGFLFLGFLLSRIPFIKKSLIPTSLIGGLSMLLVKLIPAFDELIDYNIMEMITYHCLALGFISMALKKSKKKTDKTKLVGVIDSGLLIGGSYIVQAAVGILITILICTFLSNTGLIPASGLLLALGFGQGSGQALNYGKMYETDYGFVGGASFGLSIATVGFLVAAIVGVICINIYRHKTNQKREEQWISQSQEEVFGENEIADTPSIDKATVNLIFVFAIYGLVYLVMYLVNVNLVWGFNFLLGTLFATLARAVINLLEKKKIVTKEPLNNYILNRSGNFFYDVMIITGCAAINLNTVSAYWWEIALICGLGAVATFFYVWFCSKEAYKGYFFPGFISMFGMLTGTASSGMILLREVDPKYETDAANNLVLGGIPAIAFAGGLLILLSYAPEGMTQSWICFGILIAALVLISIALFRRKIFRRKKSDAEDKKE